MTADNVHELSPLLSAGQLAIRTYLYERAVARLHFIPLLVNTADSERLSILPVRYEQCVHTSCPAFVFCTRLPPGYALHPRVYYT